MKPIHWMTVVCIAFSCAVLVAGVSTASAVVEGSVGKLTNKPKGDKCKLVAKQIKVTNVGPDLALGIMLSMYLSPEPQVTAEATLLDTLSKDELDAGDMFATSDDKKKYKLKKKVERSLLTDEPWVIVVLEDSTQAASGDQIFTQQVSECEVPQPTGSTPTPPVASAPPGPLATGKFAAAAYIALGLSGIGDPQSIPDDNMDDSDGGGAGGFDPNDPGGFDPGDIDPNNPFPDGVPGLPPGCDINDPTTCIPDFFKSFSIVSARTPQSPTKAQFPGVGLPCSISGSTTASLNPLDGTTTFENCSTPVDTTGDGVDDAVEIKDGTITNTTTDTGRTVDQEVTTRVERLSDGQFISQDVVSSNSQTTNTQTEECAFPGSPVTVPIPVRTSIVSMTTTQETADTNGDGTIDKDVDTTGDGLSDVTLGFGLTSLCDAFADGGGTDIAVAVTFSGNGSWTNNLSGQTVTSSIDPNNPVMMMFMTTTVDGKPQSSVEGGGTISTSGLDCLPAGSVTFDTVTPVVTQGVSNTFVGGQLNLSGVGGTGVVNITSEGIEVIGDDGTTGFLDPALFGDPFWWCNPMP